MSVVNQMLKDLDKRQQQHDFKGVAQTQPSPSDNRSSSWRLLVLGLFLGALLAVGGWWLMNDAESTLAAKPPVAAPAANTRPAAAESLSVAKDAKEPSAIQKAQPEVTSDHSLGKEKTVALASPEPQPQQAGQAPTATQASASVTQNKPVESATVANLNVSDPETKPSAAPRADAEESSATHPPKPAANQMHITEVELTPAQIAQKQLSQAKSLLADGNNQEAMIALREALHNDASLHEARRQLAALYFAEGKLDDAEAILQLGVEIYSQHEEFWLLLARVQIAKLQWQQADASLSHIANTSTLASEKWLAKIRIAQQQKNWQTVQQGYQQMILIAPEDGRWHFGYAHALDAQGQYAEAIPEYQKALKMSGLSVDARAYIQNRLLQIGDSR